MLQELLSFALFIFHHLWYSLQLIGQYEDWLSSSVRSCPAFFQSLSFFSEMCSLYILRDSFKYFGQIPKMMRISCDFFYPLLHLLSLFVRGKISYLFLCFLFCFLSYIFTIICCTFLHFHFIHFLCQCHPRRRCSPSRSFCREIHTFSTLK